MILEKESRELVDTIAEIARKQILGETYSNYELAEVLNNIFSINIYYSDTDKFDGYLGTESIRGEIKPMIVLSTNQSKERQLFTLAHELGHLIMHYGYLPGQANNLETKEDVLSVSGYRRDVDQLKETTDPLELQANEFAGAFLMPEESTRDIINTVESVVDQAAIISKRFGVTDKAAIKRIQVLKNVEGIDHSR